MVNIFQTMRSLLWSVFTESNYKRYPPGYQHVQNYYSNQIIQYGYLNSHGGERNYQIKHVFTTDN